VDEAARLVLAAKREPDVRAKKRAPVAAAPGEPPTGTEAGESLAAAEGRRVVREGASRTFSEGMALETEAFLRLAGTAESKRLIDAFFASRKK
jgi:enoyl-CoA hydratase